MVKVTNVMGDEYKGRQGNAVYQKFYGKQVRRLWDGKKKNKAPGQEEQKKRFKIGNALWKSLTEEEKKALKEYLRDAGINLTPQQWCVTVALTRPQVVVQEREILANVIEWVSGWDAVGWPYRQEITISNGNSTDLTDYQVRIDLTADNVGANFDWSRQGADLRFYDEDGNKLSYWVETWDSTSKQATVWVKVSSIKANSSTSIKMYYGNATAESESDGSAVFDLFDDFNTNNLTELTWESPAATDAVVSDGILSFNKHSDGYTLFKWDKTINLPAVIEARWNGTKSGSKGEIWGGFLFIKQDGSGAFWVDYWYRLGGRKVDSGGKSDLKICYDGTHPAYGQWWITTLIIKVDGSLGWKWGNNDYTCSVTPTYLEQTPKLGIVGPYYSDTNYELDWVRVRKYATAEQSVSLRDEEIGYNITKTTVKVKVKEIEGVAIDEITVYDDEGSAIWSKENLTNIGDKQVTTRVTLPQDVTEKGVKAIVRNAAGVVDVVNL